MLPLGELANAPSVGDGLADLWQRAWTVWVAGGWAMVPIALTAATMFGVGTSLWLRFRGKGFRSVPEKVWRVWIEHPTYREGPIGRLLDVVGVARTLEASAAAFAGVRQAELTPFERDLKVMKVCVAVGPLLGLLGTVTGMLSTFGALATGAGGDQTMAAVARGISEALITTETGLVVALPGLFFHYQLARQRDRLAAFLAHVETVCTQHLHRRLQSERAA